MAENVFTITKDELYPTCGAMRFAPVRQIFIDAFLNCRDQRKMMLDPMDILQALMRDPELEKLLEVAGVNREDLEAEIEKVEAGTPKGFSALRILNMANAVEDFRPYQYRSFMLDQAILLGVRLADEERSFHITGHHILAGILRQGMNTGASVFNKLGLSQRQLRILARVPLNTN